MASRKGLVAAAGPDAVYIAATEAVRKAFESQKISDSEVRPFEAQAKVPLPIRISQLSFTADEKYLILSAEAGGGLALYEVQSLAQGSAQTSFELNTNGETLRQLVPNPMPELSGLCAVVTDNGNLMMANLQERTLVSGPNGTALRSQITCASWSTKGKQLVAGSADGTIQQMTPDGVEKGRIPKPPNLGDYHVASVTWLENHVFLVVHNPTNGTDSSVYHIITRQQPPGGAPPSFSFQKLTDPVEPFGSEKVPHHSVLRLRGFPPNLDDLLIVSSTATDSIGLLSRSKSPLDNGKPAESITNVFTTTELADDSKRAQLPMSEDLLDTYPIGTALDLSSKDKVYKPIPTDEIEQSPGPLPGLWVMNNEGVLASWWVVYNESVRAGTSYPGLAAVEGPVAAQSTPSAKPAVSAFASPAGATSSAFGSPSALGGKSSPWSSNPPASGITAPPAFGSTTFGNAAASAAPKLGSTSFGSSAFGSKPAAPAFGQSSMMGGLGAKPSPWATGSASTAAPAFGQSGFASAGGAAHTGKVFGSSTLGSQPASSRGFSGFASKGGFASFAGNNNSQSIFGQASGTAVTDAPEVSMDTDTSFPSQASKPQGSSAFGSSPFVLGTTFKPDPKTANENERSTTPGKDSLFGGSFGLSLDDAPKLTPSAEKNDEDMGAATPTRPKSLFSQESTTPTTTPAPQKFGFVPTPATSTSAGLFGSKPSSGGFGGLFGSSRAAPADPPEAIAPTKSPEIKKEDEEDEEDKENLANIPPAPLPPDTTSKATYPFGDSSSSSSGSSFSPFTVSKTPPKAADDAPLPPDFLDKPPSASIQAPPLPSQTPEKRSGSPEAADSQSKTPEDAPLPPDFLPNSSSTRNPPTTIPSIPESPEPEEGGDDEEEQKTEVASEGSGIDVAQDLSPENVDLGTQTPGYTPQSSFAGMAGSAFSSFSRPEAESSRPLFGEISRNAPPLFPKPVPPSPRSPSPIRPAIPPHLHKSEPSRSVSAPGMASHILGKQPQPQQTPSAFGRAGKSGFALDPNVEEQRRLQAKRNAENAQILVDPEDEGIQQLLRSEIEATTDLDEFVAVDSQLPAALGSEVESGCELLWRDINRMVDHLGLNSRSLQSFIKGHLPAAQRGRTRDDLENPDDWVMVDSKGLNTLVVEDLAQELEDGRVQDIEQTQDAIKAIARDLSRLRAKEEDMRRVIMAHIDPDQIALTKALPLSAEQSAQQNELRRAYANFSKQLSDAEQGLTLLKAKLASINGSSGKANVPTVEAVLRTINKMTNMAEKRSGDIDVLENQMRKLRLGSVGPNGSSPAPRSRECSPFVASTPQRRSVMFSPDGLRSSLVSSAADYRAKSASPRRKMSTYSEEERKVVLQKKAKRAGILDLLRSSLESSGPNVSRLDDDD